MISFIFSNPSHHLEMMAPVARELTRRGQRTQLVSLAELRGFRTPAWPGADELLVHSNFGLAQGKLTDDAPMVRVMPD